MNYSHNRSNGDHISTAHRCAHVRLVGQPECTNLGTVHLMRIERGLPVETAWVCEDHADETRYGDWRRVEEVE